MGNVLYLLIYHGFIKKKKDIHSNITEETEDNEMSCFSDFDEGRLLGEDESVVAKWINPFNGIECFF